MLYKDKGTPIRLIFELSNGEFVLINPLEFSSSGLKIMQPSNDKAGSIELVDDKDREVASITLPKNSVISKIESFVLYPDGATWTGRILIDKELIVEKLIWKKELSDTLDLKDVSLEFVNDDWQKIPTIIGIYRGEKKVDCSRLYHTCPDCSKFSKIIPVNPKNKKP